MSFSPALAAYRTATALLGPFAGLWLRLRANVGKEDSTRLQERFGRYTQARPAGALMWLHAASVGESGVALQLIEAIAARQPEVSFLMTTGTRTSAALVERAAPVRTHHVYAPLDRRDAVRRFLAHWRPDIGVFVESEVWPHLILEAHAAGVRLALVNARMSIGTLHRWRAWRSAGRRLFGAFAFAAAADERTADVIARLRAEAPHMLGNLKLAAPAPPVDQAVRAALAAEIGGRPLWLAASTHAGEEEIVLEAHARLRRDFPEALLIVAPRHPERGEAVAALAGGAPRRSHGEKIGVASIYIADTMGEMGALYNLAPVALVAGSMLAHLRGHNPIEPAKLGAAIISGPHVESFEPVYAALHRANAAIFVGDARELAAAVAQLWGEEAARSAQTSAARAYVAQNDGVLDRTVDELLALLPRQPKGAALAPA